MNEDHDQRITLETLTVGLDRTQAEVQSLSRGLENIANEMRDSVRTLADKLVQSHNELTDRIAHTQQTSWPLVVSGLSVIITIVGMAAALVMLGFSQVATETSRNEKNISSVAEVSRLHNLEPWHQNAGSDLLHIKADMRVMAQDRERERVRVTEIDRAVSEKIGAMQAEVQSLKREAFGPATRIDEIERMTPKQ